MTNTQFIATAYINNADGTVTNHRIISCDHYNQTIMRKEVCKFVNKFISKDLKGEIRIINQNAKLVKMISFS